MTWHAEAARRVLQLEGPTPPTQRGMEVGFCGPFGLLPRFVEHLGRHAAFLQRGRFFYLLGSGCCRKTEGIAIVRAR